MFSILLSVFLAKKKEQKNTFELYYYSFTLLGPARSVVYAALNDDGLLNCYTTRYRPVREPLRCLKWEASTQGCEY
jgi:hypothetical protein